MNANRQIDTDAERQTKMSRNWTEVALASVSRGGAAEVEIASNDVNEIYEIASQMIREFDLDGFEIVDRDPSVVRFYGLSSALNDLLIYVDHDDRARL